MPVNAQQDIIKSLFELSGITKETVTDELQKLLRDASRPVILFWDIDDIVQATSFKKTFLEENILCHPKVKQYEMDKLLEFLELAIDRKNIFSEYLFTHWGE